MRTHIRKARPEDVTAILNIKNSLPMPQGGPTTTTGGFILGTTPEQYALYIQYGNVLIAENNDNIIGYGISLPDAMLRASELWAKRHLVDWDLPLEPFESKTLCYFDQLAFLPGHRRMAVMLSFRLVKDAFEAGCDAVFAATVRKPVLNLAAVPFILAVGGVKAGNIDEQYPDAGHVNSDIYVITRQAFYEKGPSHPLYAWADTTVGGDQK